MSKVEERPIYKHWYHFLIFFVFLLVTAISAYVFSPVIISSADTATETVGTYTISIASDDEANINITPTSSQTVYTTSSPISITNTCPSGMSVYLNTAGENNALLNDGNSSYYIPTTSSTILSNNTWGYSIDSGETWYGVPNASETSAIVYNSSSAQTDPLDVDILFGVKIDNQTVSGKYLNDVVYTMVPDQNCFVYNIAWDSDGGINPDDLPEAMNLDGTINLSVLSRPTRNYYSFAGWSNGTTTFTGDETAANINPNNEPSIVMTALWSPVPYSISYTLNGGSVATSNPATYDVETNSFTLVNPTRANYTFKGWSGTGLTGDTNLTVTIPAGSHDDRTYTANWTPTNFTITYTLNGGSATNNTTYNVETNTFTLNNPTRSAYTFVGWSGTGLSGTGNKTVTITKGSTGNRSYTANWTPTNYTISYTLNGGSASNPTSYNIETNTFTLNNPTRASYTFTGWSGTGLSGTGNKTVTITKGSTGNRSYTANWAAACSFTSKGFDYTGSVQSWTVPTGCGGTYKLEVYGAQGGAGGGCTGGKGGYSYGNVSLSDGATVYVAVGGQGSYVANRSNSAGGWNGGGGVGNLDGNNYVGTGGGATHMAKTNRGVLANYNSYRSEVYLVAGGGGGGFGIWWDEHYIPTAGSAGGGTSGGGGSFGAAGAGGNQGGGGGGWSGGLSARPATGGTGYVGGVSSGSTVSDQRAGNGYAKITKV